MTHGGDAVPEARSPIGFGSPALPEPQRVDPVPEHGEQRPGSMTIDATIDTSVTPTPA